jgi:hypothetical protein
MLNLPQGAMKAIKCHIGICSSMMLDLFYVWKTPLGNNIVEHQHSNIIINKTCMHNLLLSQKLQINSHLTIMAILEFLPQPPVNY